MTGEEMAVKLAETEARSKSNTHRLDHLEKSTEAINRLATSVEVMAKEQKHQTEAIKEVKTDLSDLSGKVEKIEAEPGNRWKTHRRESDPPRHCGGGGLHIGPGGAMSGKYEAKTPSRLSRLVKADRENSSPIRKGDNRLLCGRRLRGELVRAPYHVQDGKRPRGPPGRDPRLFRRRAPLAMPENRPQKGRQGRTNNKRFRGHRDLTRGKDYTMNEKIIKRIANLLSVKSIVTITLTAVFAYLAVTNKIAQDFMTVYAVVIAFYFGTQTQREQSTTDGTQTTEEGK